MNLECLNRDCNSEIHFKNFDDLDEVVICPKCATEYKVCYDESYDHETGEEDSFWWLERLK